MFWLAVCSLRLRSPVGQFARQRTKLVFLPPVKPSKSSAVLLRAKFDRYADVERRRQFLERYKRIAEMIVIPAPVRACRDPKDDKFLSLAVFGEADLIVSGDADLLVLSPFRTIKIVSPVEYFGR